MESSKSRGTTPKREINPEIYELILNLDQIPLGLVSASKLAPFGSHMVSTIHLGFSFLNGF